MNLSEEIIKFAKDNNCQIISLKYLEENGFLQQIDISANNILVLNTILMLKNINLTATKFFLDPFRSVVTLNIFCINEKTGLSQVEFNKSINSNLHKNIDNISAEIIFRLSDDTQFEENNVYTSAPEDLDSNLRSEIILTLENIGVKTTHHQGKTKYESVIGITSNSLFELADDLIVSNYIIKNCAASYGKKVYFKPDHFSNLIISVIGNNNYFKSYNSIITTRLNNVLSYSCNLLQFKFEIKGYNDYSISNKLLFNIEINTDECYIPHYLLIKIFNNN